MARQTGVVAFSSGNHAQGVAYAAYLLQMPATIVMPSDAPAIKLEGTRRWGATVRLYDRDRESREEIAAEIAQRSGATLVPAFDDVHVISGQGTVGLEIMEQCRQLDAVPDCVLVPCGGGGLLAGVATAVTAMEPAVEVYGVEPEHWDDHRLSLAAGERVRISPQQATACDALMATQPGEITWQINRDRVTDFLVVSEDEIAAAIRFSQRALKLVLEPGGAVALAAVLEHRPELAGKTAVVVLSGGNIDSQQLATYLNARPNPV
ncbi:MAG: threonine/serine dehydratase [Gammaproteobacteria bacterium]